MAGYEWLITKLIPLGDDAIEPIGLVVLVVLYEAMANLCYTLGWVVELWGRKADPMAARQRGEWMFRVGLLFSAVLTALPFWFACVCWTAYRLRESTDLSRSRKACCLYPPLIARQPEAYPIPTVRLPANCVELGSLSVLFCHSWQR